MKNFLYFWGDIIVCCVFVVMVYIGTFFFLIQIEKAQEEEKGAPCSSFAMQEIGHVPARCLSYFKDK